MSSTHVILDGLSDPRLGQQLSRAWADAGVDNEVDVSGQCATLSIDGTALTEPQMDRAAVIARVFAVEPRDRVGTTYQPDNKLDQLRDRVAYEYKSRFATALVFGLPALAVHYLGPVLTGATATPRDLLYPWLIELLLVGWLCVAAGWPILFQAALSLRYLRATADLLTAAIVLIAFVPSVIGWVGLIVDSSPAMEQVHFHVAAYAVMFATLQRWLLHRRTAQIAGRADLMIHHFGRVITTWLALMLIAGMFGDVRAALAVGLLLPPMLSLGAVNRWSPGPSIALPVFGFVIVLLLGPRMVQGAQPVLIEIAAGFQLLMIVTFAMGWRSPGKAGG
jgi:hypothetical protein